MTHRTMNLVLAGAALIGEPRVDEWLAANSRAFISREPVKEGELAQFGLGAVCDATGSFAASLWVMFATALLLVCAALPLTTTRLRPA